MLIGVAVRVGETNGNGWLGELTNVIQSIKLHDGIKFPDSSRHVFIYNTGLAGFFYSTAAVAVCFLPANIALVPNERGCRVILKF